MITDDIYKMVYTTESPYNYLIWHQVMQGLHYHNFYEYYIVTSGRAIHSVNGVNEVISRGSLVFIRPEDSHTLRKYVSDNFAMINTGIRCDEVERLSLSEREKNMILEPAIPRSVKLSENALSYLTEQHSLAAELSDDEEAYVRIFRNILCNIVIQLVYAGKTETVTPEWFSEMLDNYEKEENISGNIDTLVKCSGKSYSHISHCFIKYLGITPSNYIMKKHVDTAQRMLSETNMDILDICYAAGFESISYFYKAFRSVTGTTPFKYRRRHMSDTADK